jgi:hypothetical protein
MNALLKGGKPGSLAEDAASYISAAEKLSNGSPQNNKKRSLYEEEGSTLGLPSKRTQQESTGSQMVATNPSSGLLAILVTTYESPTAFHAFLWKLDPLNFKLSVDITNNGHCLEVDFNRVLPADSLLTLIGKEIVGITDGDHISYGQFASKWKDSPLQATIYLTPSHQVEARSRVVINVVNGLTCVTVPFFTQVKKEDNLLLL